MALTKTDDDKKRNDNNIEGQEPKVNPEESGDDLTDKVVDENKFSANDDNVGSSEQVLHSEFNEKDGYDEVYETPSKNFNLSADQIKELETRGLLSGDVKPIDTEKIDYVLNLTNGLLVLPDLGKNGFALKARQLVNLTKLFTSKEVLHSESIRESLRSGDLKAVKLSEIKQEDIAPRKSDLDKLEKQYEITEDGTKIPLKVNRNNNPFFARLWKEENKIVRENKMKRQNINLDEVPLHAEERFKEFGM